MMLKEWTNANFFMVAKKQFFSRRANFIETHTFDRVSILHFGNHTVVIFLYNVRNKCYSMPSTVLNLLCLCSLYENPMNGKTKKIQKTDCEPTNWSEPSTTWNTKLQTRSIQMRMRERKRQRAAGERMRQEPNTGNTPQSRTTAQTRTANQWMEYNIVWSHAFTKIPFEWIFRCVSANQLVITHCKGNRKQKANDTKPCNWSSTRDREWEKTSEREWKSNGFVCTQNISKNWICNQRQP